MCTNKRSCYICNRKGCVKMATADAPKYIDLMNWIREQILSGEFNVGMRLPSENELGKKFLISRQTVRQATSVLESEGLLERRRGSGTYVSATKSMAKKARVILV